MGSEVLNEKSFKLFHHPAKIKKYSQTVLLIHHMGGNHRTTNRHVRLLNRMGYDCVTFDILLGTNFKYLRWHPLLKKAPGGVFALWTKQINLILNELLGEKIVYSFSGPALSALCACSQRADIKKIICDGGPFADIYKNTRHVYTHELDITNPILNPALSLISSVAWGYRPLKTLHKALQNWSPTCPILSIRGTSDPIVDISSIRKVFAPHPSLPLQILEIDGGKHLNGLRDHRDLYTETLNKFLLQT